MEPNRIRKKKSLPEYKQKQGQSWKCTRCRRRLAVGRNFEHRRINCRGIKRRWIIVMPDCVANAGGIALIRGTSSCLSLLDRLAIKISKIPKICDWLIHTRHQVILCLASVELT